MYNFKEKSKHLKNLLAPNHAERDLEMLKRLDPLNDQLRTFEHAPVRNAERILYLLLDIASAEDIRNNRRTHELKTSEETKAVNNPKMEELKTKLDDAEFELEQADDEKSVLEKKVSELEAEKKSTQTSKKSKAVSSKKKTSIQKSAGKISKTKTSR